MKRRAFVRALAGAVALAPLGMSAGGSASQPVSRDQICGVRSAFRPIAAAVRPRGLSYQGTHILAYGALRDLASSFASSGRGSMEVAGGGCDDGIAGVRRGTADLGGLCCPVSGSAAEGLPWLLVARDLKAVVAHTSNPISDIGMEELKALARGRIRNWRELGWDDRPIAQVVRRHCPEYAEPVRRLLLENLGDWSAQSLFVDTDEQIVDLVSRFPSSIGVVSWVFARPMAERGRLRVLAVDGRRPDAQPHRYPITGPLSLVFRAWDPDTMAGFFDFLYSPEGRAIISRRLLAVSAAEAGYRGSGTIRRS